jgi:predicted permease
MAAEVGVVMAASFSTMVLGSRLSSSLGPEARKGISYLYANLVFPAMVFRGVAALDLSGVDRNLLLTILLSKLAVATACLLFGLVALGSRGLPHAAAYAMAASHSFDVTMGVPIATVPVAPPPTRQ